MAHIHMRHPSIADIYECVGCGLRFADPASFVGEDEYQFQADLKKISGEEGRRFSRIFGEGIDTSDEQGNMYADFGLSQADMEEGLFELVDRAIAE